jgi:hypothetical protein
MTEEMNHLLHKLRSFVGNYNNFVRRIGAYLNDPGKYDKDDLKESCRLALENCQKLQAMLDEMDK